MSFFLRHSAEELNRALLRREISASEIAEGCIRSIERLEPHLHAWVNFDPDLLRARAAASDIARVDSQQHRSWESIPFGVKDIFNTADYPTEMGSEIWRGFTPGNDARAVFHLQRAGALVAGKTTTAEFAVHKLGKTRNPHADHLTPGTSSSGSAVSVATGMVPLALATQTAGSIVRPASFCGVYGYKPSFGLIPRMGMLKTTDSLDTVGFFVTHLSDLRNAFEALRVHGQNYPISHARLNDPSRQQKPPGRPWRLGLLRPDVSDLATFEAREALEKWLARVGAHAEFELISVTLPSSLKRAHEVHALIYEKSLAYYFEAEARQLDRVSPVMSEMIERGKDISIAEYRAALLEQDAIAADIDEAFCGFDVGVTLSTSSTAVRREEVELPDSALIWNLAHLPTMSAPALQTISGLPLGVQLVARRYSDYLLLSCADALANCELLPPRGPDSPFAVPGSEEAAKNPVPL